jgi:protein-tyrosine-phosphatase
MAEAFFSFLAGERYRTASAGTQPAAAAHPEVIASMKERGITLQDGPGHLLTTELAESAHRVIGMGCNVEEACPALRVPLEDWDLSDPKGKPSREVNLIRDEIEERVRTLLTELDGKPT